MSRRAMRTLRRHGKPRAAGLAPTAKCCQLAWPPPTTPTRDHEVREPESPTAGPPVAKEAILSNYLLKLYVTGKTPRAEQAIANLRRLCVEELDGQYELQIIDVLEHPQLAEDEKILATPTLIKRLPPPLRRVIGDLSDKEKVLLGLDVRPHVPPATATDTP